MGRDVADSDIFCPPFKLDNVDLAVDLYDAVDLLHEPFARIATQLKGFSHQDPINREEVIAGLDRHVWARSPVSKCAGLQRPTPALCFLSLIAHRERRPRLAGL